MGITQYYANIKLASRIMQSITHDYVNITHITHFIRIIMHNKQWGWYSPPLLSVRKGRVWEVILRGTIKLRNKFFALGGSEMVCNGV